MIILLTFGIMNPFVMVGIAIIIAADKMLPRPQTATQLFSLATILTGIAIISEKLPIK